MASAREGSVNDASGAMTEVGERGAESAGVSVVGGAVRAAFER